MGNNEKSARTRGASFASLAELNTTDLNYTHTASDNQILPARPNIAAFLLLDQAETRMARAEDRGDRDGWVCHCSIWFALHPVAFQYGQGGRQ